MRIINVADDIFRFAPGHCQGAAFWLHHPVLEQSWTEFLEMCRTAGCTFLQKTEKGWIEVAEICIAPEEGTLYRLDPPLIRLQFVYIQPNLQHVFGGANPVPGMVRNALTALNGEYCTCVAMNGIHGTNERGMHDSRIDEHYTCVLTRTTIPDWERARENRDIRQVCLVDLHGGFGPENQAILPTPTEYLRQHRVPETDDAWIDALTSCDPFPLGQILQLPTLYYPGGEIDFAPLTLFSENTNIACFVYATYGFGKTLTQATLEAEIARIPNHALKYPIRRLVPADFGVEAWADLWHPDPAARSFSSPDSGDALWAVLDRTVKGRKQRPIILVYLATEAIGTYNVLWARWRLAPEAIVIQDHGYGGNWNRFDAREDGLLYRIAKHTPPRLLYQADNNTEVFWPGYHQVSDYGPGEGGCGAGHERAVFALDQQDRSDPHSATQSHTKLSDHPVTGGNITTAQPNVPHALHTWAEGQRENLIRRVYFALTEEPAQREEYHQQLSPAQKRAYQYEFVFRVATQQFPEYFLGYHSIDQDECDQAEKTEFFRKGQEDRNDPTRNFGDSLLKMDVNRWAEPWLARVKEIENQLKRGLPGWLENG